jgi:hypothetical protein
MKKVSLISFILFVCFLWAAPGAEAQKEEFSMKPIMSKSLELVKLIEMEYGKEIVRMEFDLVQTTKQSFRTLIDKYEYGIMAFGDSRMKDIDIKVYKWVNNQWVLITKDQDSNSVAFVTVKPAFTAEYKIEITAYKFETGYDIGHYGLIVFHD